MKKYLSAVAKSCVRKYVICRMGAVSLQLQFQASGKTSFLDQHPNCLNVLGDTPRHPQHIKSYEEILKYPRYLLRKHNGRFRTN